MHHLDFLDVCGILFGILFTVAKLDAQGRKAADFPHVPAAQFERWQQLTVSIYRLASAACFVRVIFHQGWALYIGRTLPAGPVAPRGLMLLALAVDLAFIGILATTLLVRAPRARKLRRELGIVLAPMPAPAGAARQAEDADEAGAEKSKDDASSARI